MPAKPKSKTAPRTRHPRFAPGQRVWEFDINRRVYRRDAKNHSFGSPIFTEHFQSRIVEAIDGTDYRFVGRTYPSPIKTVDRECKSDAEREDLIWRNDRFKISECVRSCDLDQLKAVAAILGYVPDFGEPS